MFANWLTQTLSRRRLVGMGLGAAGGTAWIALHDAPRLAMAHAPADWPARGEDPVAELRQKVALSCRILAMVGIVGEINGHVSARVPGSEEMLLRCRGGDEYGLAYTTPAAIRRLRFDGRSEELAGQYEVPIEFPIHGETLRAHPEVGAVVHAHPPAILLCGLAGIPLRPVFGAYDPAAMGLALDAIPVYPRSVLISSPALAAEVVAVMAQREVCILRGHGVVVTGRTVEESTLRAIRLESLARVCWELARHGPLPTLPAEELASFAALLDPQRLARTDEYVWRYYVQRLEAEGLGLAPSADGAARR
jgi:ribulose-5-phosphate 4-epimerase/fuculose-1-phosphate aldolase